MGLKEKQSFFIVYVDRGKLECFELSSIQKVNEFISKYAPRNYKVICGKVVTMAFD